MVMTPASTPSVTQQEVIDFIQSHACEWSQVPDAGGVDWGIHKEDTPPHNRLLGPVFERGDTAGLILQDGRTLMTWGDTSRADMTFSVTKTYLALVAGIAFDHGLLPDLDEPVVSRLPGLGFDDEHNSQVTWRHLLQFTSEWEGSCFGVPDQVDRYREVASQQGAARGRKGDSRPLRPPGTYWEYNDVRINQFSLALMHLFGRPLPDVFREYVMQPIEASDKWCWHGYVNSWITLRGRKIQSVPGGGHWGGGMVISVQDQIRVAWLLINDGRYRQRQIVSPEWIRLMLTPCEIAPHYGFFTWLNTDHCVSTRVPAESVFSIGIGGQLIWHDPTRAVIAVLRWIDAEQTDEILGRIDALI